MNCADTRKRCLGRGVYAETVGSGHILVTTENGNSIYLWPETLRGLVHYEEHETEIDMGLYSLKKS